MSTNNPVIRIPNLPIGQIVDENGNATDDELSFRHALITSLQNNFGNEGVTVPVQAATDITTIQNNQLPNGDYSCAPGTIIYNSTSNTVMVAIMVAGVPTFKTITVT